MTLPKLNGALRVIKWGKQSTGVIFIIIRITPNRSHVPTAALIGFNCIPIVYLNLYQVVLGRMTHLIYQYDIIQDAQRKAALTLVK